MQLKIFRLLEEFSVLEGWSSKTNIWDKGELFLFREAEPKRHGKGTYPDRLISCTDGSMVAMHVVEQYEKAIGRDILIGGVFEETVDPILNAIQKAEALLDADLVPEHNRYIYDTKTRKLTHIK